MKLVKMLHLRFNIEFVSGGRIGGGGGGLEVGSVVDANLAALKDPLTNAPYLPGSSLKGKLRSIAEHVHGRFGEDRHGKKTLPCDCGENDGPCPICPVFGAHMNPKARSAPTRITVRDAFLTAESKALWESARDEGREFLEQKTENTVGRISGTADNPRTGERFPAGTTFRAHIILNIYDDDETAKRTEGYKDTVSNALAVLENGGSLGASGSRGYGEVNLKVFPWEEVEVAALRVQFTEK